MYFLCANKDLIVEVKKKEHIFFYNPLIIIKSTYVEIIQT
jgi:hypothetical protein